MSKHVFATVRDIPPGSRKRVVVKGRAVVVFNLDGEYFGLLDRCPHQGGSLCEGRLIGLLEAHEPGDYSYTRRGEIVRCPWHGWEFDIRTGRSRVDPERTKARAFAVAVAGGAELACAAGGEGEPETLQAETFKVTVEELYVVVEA